MSKYIKNMMMENRIIFNFLEKLKNNNNRDWFTENKSEYLIAKEQMEGLISEMIKTISQFDASISHEEPKKCMFRIYRDVRFSKNKMPYKTNMGSVIVAGGRKSGKAGYYIHIEPGASFLGGGVYQPQSKDLKKVREEVMYNIEEFKGIIDEPDFNSLFGEIYGEKLKRPPKDFPADFEDIELLKLKSYAIIHPLTDAQVSQADFVDYAHHVFSKMMPFNKFVNRGYEG